MADAPRQERLSPRAIRNLDRLRHSGGKASRKVKGIGRRSEQLAALTKEEVMSLSARTERNIKQRESKGFVQLNVDIPLTERERLNHLRGELSQTAFITVLLDAYERRAASVSPNSALELDVRKELDYWQVTLKVTSHLLALKALGEHRDLAAQRAARISVLEDQVRHLVGERDQARGNISAVSAQREEWQEKYRALVARQAAAEREQTAGITEEDAARLARTGQMEDIVFRFVEAFTGSTAVLDPSGEVVVTPPPDAARKIFPLWSRATRALGFKTEARVDA